MSRWETVTFHLTDEQAAEDLANYFEHHMEKHELTMVYDQGSSVAIECVYDRPYNSFIANYPKAKNIESLAVVVANDTTDSGHAKFYERQGSGFNRVDKASGYEGAYGADAAGKISEEHDVYVSRPTHDLV